MKWNLRGLIIPGDDFIVSYSNLNTFRILKYDLREVCLGICQVRPGLFHSRSVNRVTPVPRTVQEALFCEVPNGQGHRLTSTFKVTKVRLDRCICRFYVIANRFFLRNSEQYILYRVYDLVESWGVKHALPFYQTLTVFRFVCMLKRHHYIYDVHLRHTAYQQLGKYIHGSCAN